MSMVQLSQFKTTTSSCAIVCYSLLKYPNRYGLPAKGVKWKECKVFICIFRTSSSSPVSRAILPLLPQKQTEVTEYSSQKSNNHAVTTWLYDGSQLSSQAVLFLECLHVAPGWNRCGEKGSLWVKRLKKHYATSGQQFSLGHQNPSSCPWHDQGFALDHQSIVAVICQTVRLNWVQPIRTKIPLEAC